MLDEGAAGRSALQLNEELQRLATDYGAWAEKDALVMSMNMLADQLQPSLVLMRDVLLSPAFNKDEFDRRKRYRIAEVMAHEADPGAVRMRVLSRVLFGEGYGGLPAVGLPATLRTIELADVQAQYKALVKPSGATLVVVGDVTRAQLEPVLAAQFGKWQGKPNAKLAAVAPSSLPMGAIYMADFPGSTQSSIALARRVEGTQAKDFFAALLFNRTLGGAFSSRLNLNLREDKGYTYGARSSFWRYRQAGVFSLRAKVKRETTKASITEMYAELQGMQTTKPFARAEYQEAVEGLLLGYPGRFERLGSVAGQLSSQAVSGRQAGWLRGWPAQLEATPYEAALASSRAQTGKDAFAIIVAGDRAKIGASLAELRMPIYRCEADGSCRPAE
jgi:zinc protease